MKKALITGGGGFVGQEIVRQLVDRGVECLVVGRNHYPEVSRLGATCLQGDIRDKPFLVASSAGVDTVFHVASLAGIWGPWKHYYGINVEGTANVLAACRKNGIPRMVYTSTPSVVFASDDICMGDERLPYPPRFLCHYARSKAMAEQMVLSENSEDIVTCAIRPHLIWGPGDPHLVPRLIERGKGGQLQMVGDGTNLVDISYVDNVALAHLLAADNLEGSKTAAGQAYFINQGEPVNLWQWIGDLFDQLDIPPVTRKVSFSMAYRAGFMLEMVYTALRKKSEPKMTRFLAEQLAKSHYFSSEKARRDLGYTPYVSTAQGMKRLLEWIKTS